MLNISDNDVERALDFLRDSAPLIAAAVAEQARAHNMLKHTKALAMKASGEKSAAAQEREAYASEIYVEAVDNEFEATKRAAELKAQREAASAKIEAWRSASANFRAMNL